MTDVKICGLTRPQDVELACDLGAAYLGFNFAAESPRRVSPAAARELARAGKPAAARVGVFIAESQALIREAIEAAGLDLVQIHRPLRETDLDLPCPVLAVARLERGSAAAPEERLLARCRLLLFDAEVPGRPGGTGETLDWNALAGRRWGVSVMLAGGLGPDNVRVAIARTRPWAVDASSSLEASPGIKDPQRVLAFIAAAREASA